MIDPVVNIPCTNRVMSINELAKIRPVKPPILNKNTHPNLHKIEGVLNLSLHPPTSCGLENVI